MQPTRAPRRSARRADAEGSAQAHADGDRILSNPELVRFDWRTRAFLGLLLAFLTLGTALKLHGSSIGIWHDMLSTSDPDLASPDRGVLFGTPQSDRIDEWNIFTPAIVSQATVHPPFPITNSRWGAAQVPLVFKFPVRHWSMLVRPQFWAFFILDLERAYAFYWDVRAVLLIGGMFLLLMLLTGNDFWVSVLGAIWVFFSGFIQWWYSNQLLPETIGCLALLIVAGHYLLLSSRRWVIAVAGVTCLICALDFALALYPPYQVPLLYLGIVVGAASLGPRLRASRRNGPLGYPLARMGLVLSGVLVLLGLFYRDARESIQLMRATVYPGSRLVSGGDLTAAQVFGGFFGFFMRPEHFPVAWENVCEASNFLLLFPIPAAVLIWRWWEHRSTTAVEWSLLGYILVLLTWTMVGWPHWLAVGSGLGLSPPVRSLVGLGLASILLCCLFLAKSHEESPRRRGRLVVVGCFSAALLVYTLDFNRVTSGFAARSQMALVVLAGGAAGYLLMAPKRIAFAVCVLVPHIWSYGLVNPVAVGLGPILEAKVFQRMSQFVAEDPDARWVAYVEIASATLLKMAGAHVFNGINIIPPIEDLHVIDPEGRGMPVYNRYGYIALMPASDSAIGLSVVRKDLYEMHVDPKSDVWRDLGIRYIVLPGASTDPEFLAKTTLVQPLPRVWIYKLLDSGGPARDTPPP